MEGGFAYGNIVTYSPENSHISLRNAGWMLKWKLFSFRRWTIFFKDFLCQVVWPPHFCQATDPIWIQGSWAGRLKWPIHGFDCKTPNFHGLVTYKVSPYIHGLVTSDAYNGFSMALEEYLQGIHRKTPPKKNQISVSIYHPYITNKKANHFFCCPHKNGGKSPKEDFPKFLSLKPARYSDTNLCCGQKLGGVEFLRKTCGNIETNERISIISKTTRLLLILVLFMM